MTKTNIYTPMLQQPKPNNLYKADLIAAFVEHKNPSPKPISTAQSISTSAVNPGPVIDQPMTK